MFLVLAKLNYVYSTRTLSVKEHTYSVSADTEEIGWFRRITNASVLTDFISMFVGAISIL